MKLPIYLLGHPVLRAETKDVTPDYPDIRKLVADMFETMYFSEGVGLAAPQVGLPIRLVVIDADPVAEAFPECKDRKFALINPKVTVLDGEPASRAEGCLSIPGISEDVKRVEHIRLEWLDEDFKSHDEEISGFLARIVQHECDHLEGKVFTDHCSVLRRQFIKPKLRQIAEGRVHPDYPHKAAPRRHK